MAEKGFGRLIAFSLSEHHRFEWLSVFGMAFVASTLYWMRYEDRLKAYFLS